MTGQSQQGAVVLEVEGFSVSTASGWETPRVNVRLGRGELWLVTGPGGTGKSLVSEWLVGIPRPGTTASGQIRHASASGALGYVPQDPRLAVLPTDRVRTVLGGRRTASADVRRDPRVLFDRLRLDPARLLDLRIKNLSASERTRVLVLRAVLVGAPLLVLDSITDKLDPEDISAVFSLLRDELSAGTSCVFTTRRTDLSGLSPTVTTSLGELVREELPVPLLRRTDLEPQVAHAQPLLEVERLRVERGSRGLFSRRPSAHPLDGASLFLRHGEVLVVLGAAGSGKTTLLETIAGLHRPTAGRLRVLGQDVTHARGRRLRTMRRLVQLVFQDAGSVLEGRRTVRQHLEEAGRIARHPTGRPAEWLEKLGLSPRLLETRADVLSASEAARVDFARSLAVGPKAVLLDAPKSAGVRSDGSLLGSLIHAERDAGTSFLVTTSDPEVARTLADRVAVLFAGRIVELGSRKAVLDSPAHPYTRALLGGAPLPPRDPSSSSRACPYVSLCPRKELPRCAVEEPPLLPLPGIRGPEGRHRAACFHPELPPERAPR